MHTAQSMHSSGSIVRKLGPSRKQSTGQTSTQSVYLQRIHCSVTTWVMVLFWRWGKPRILTGGAGPVGGGGAPCRGSSRFQPSTDEERPRGAMAGGVHQHQGS